MNIEVTARHFTLPDNIREYAIKKVNKVNRYFDNTINCRITLSHENGNNLVEINLSLSGKQLHVKEVSDNMMKSIDGAVEKLVTRVMKFKTKLQTHH